MADQGSIAKLAGNTVAPLPNQRSLETTTQSRRVATAGTGRREVPNAKSRQWVDIDGKQFSRTAPRGSYLNILV
jgi:hypothetical protein